MIFAFALIVCSAAEFKSMIVYSEKTPASLVGEISDFIVLHSEFDLSMKAMTEKLTESLDSFDLLSVFDFTFSVSYEYQLKSFCSQYHLIYFSRSSEKGGEWVFDLHPSPLTQAKAIYALLQELEWKEYHLISSESDESRFIYQYLSKDPFVVISSEVDQEVFDLHIGREVKPTGNWKVVAITDSKGASKVVQALKNMRIYKERCGLIITSKGTGGQFDIGTIVLSEEGLGFSRSEEEYEVNSILRALSILNEISANGQITDKERLRSLLEQNSPDHIVSNAYSILNYNPSLSVIGNITQSFTVHIGPIVFPGNVTEFNRSPPEINISANLGSLNYDGSTSRYNSILSPGIEPMRQIINSDPDLLSNFVLKIHPTDCGYSLFKYDYVSECMQKHFNSLGAFYIDSALEEVVEGNIQIFRENGIVVPHTTILYDGSEFCDKELYPELFITTPNSLYILSILPYIINSFGWKEIMVYFHDTIKPESADAFMKNAEILEINVKNKNMIIPLDNGPGFFITNEKALKEVASSNCRILVLFLNPAWFFDFMESLYHLGLRRGDIVVVTSLALSSSIELESIYGHNKHKVLELVDGSLSLVMIEYTGQYGEDLEKQIAEKIYPYPTEYTSFQIDALLLGVHTIDLMLNIGRNYEDPLDMNYFLRQIEFTGCSGLVSIDSGGNGRSVISFKLKNFYVKEDNDWVEDGVGYYTIGIMFPLQIFRNITWPNGSLEVPKDTIEEPKCGIKESDIQENTDSIMITVYGSIAYFLVVFVGSLVVWFRFYRIEVEELSGERQLMFEDGVEIAVPFIEGCQYVALGSGASLLSFLSEALKINSMIEFEGENFWRIFAVLSGIALFWTICILTMIFSFDKKLPKFMKDFIRYFGLTMLPLVSKIAFIYILWTIMRIFECKEGVGEIATDAFLKEDCRIKCWSGHHLILSIYSLIVLTVYSFSSAISSTVYDEAMDHVSIKTKPFFSFWKSMVNILCVLLHFHLNALYPLILSVCLFFLFVVWSLFCLKVNSFNFRRLCMWQGIVALGVCLHFFINIIEQLSEYNVLITVLLDLLIIGILAASGFFAQYKYFEGCFYRQKPRNFAKLLKFAYTGKINPRELTEHQLDYKKKQKNKQKVPGDHEISVN